MHLTPKSTLVLAALAALSLGTAARPAHAQTSYSSEAAFQTAAGPLTTVGFEDIAPDAFYTPYGSNGSLTLSGATFTAGNGASLFVIGKDYYGSGSATSAYLNVDYGAPDDLLTVALPTGTKAVGTEFGGLDNLQGTASFLVTLSNGDSYTVSSPGATADSFFGYTTDTGTISSISFESGSYETFDNFQFSSAAVPEASTTASFGLLLALGLGGLVVAKKKKASASI